MKIHSGTWLSTISELSAFSGSSDSLFVQPGLLFVHADSGGVKAMNGGRGERYRQGPGQQKLLVISAESPIGRHDRRKGQETGRVDEARPSLESEHCFQTLTLRDIRTQAEVREFTDILGEVTPAEIFVDQVLEQMVDPRPMMQILRKYVRRNPSTVLSIRSRILQARGSRLSGTKIWSSRREWTMTDFDGFLEALDLHVNSEDLPEEGLLTVQVSPHDRYDSCSKRPSINFSALSLIITKEMAGVTRASGGIGTFVDRQLTQEANDNHLVLVVTEHADQIVSGHIRDPRIVLLDQTSISIPYSLDFSPELEVQVLEAVLALCFVLDNLVAIEYPDYQGIGFRVAQASHSGLLPEGVSTICWAHGSHHYLDWANGKFGKVTHPRTYLKERICIERSDKTLFLSEFVWQIYTDRFGLKPAKPEVLRLGPSVTALSAEFQSSEVSALVWIGKPTAANGFTELEELVSMVSDAKEGWASSISSIYLFGLESVPKMVQKKAGSLEVVASLLPYQELKKELGRLSGKALGVVNYKGDNAPIVVYDFLQCNIGVISYNTGGVPEMVPEHLRDQVLSDPNPLKLCQRLQTFLGLSPAVRQGVIHDWLGFLSERSEVAQKRYETLVLGGGAHHSSLIKTRPKLTVGVTNFNGSYSWLKQLQTGLENSTYPIEEIVIVDDGSDENAKWIVEKWAGSISIPTKLILHEHNQGLSAARNTILSHARTPLLFFHDNDDVVHPHCFSQMVNALLLNPSAAVALSFSRYFREKNSDEEIEPLHGGYQPIGQDLGLGLAENVFGPANGCFRTEILTEIGGWKGEKGGTWEDWALYLEFTARGYEIVTVPRPLFAYRVRKNSMLRSGREHLGRAALANSLSHTVPPEFAFGLIATQSGHGVFEDDLLKVLRRRIGQFFGNPSWRVLKDALLMLGRALCIFCSISRKRFDYRI